MVILSIKCQFCEQNKYTNRTSQTVCENCPEGKKSLPGSASCIPCDAGKQEILNSETLLLVVFDQLLFSFSFQEAMNKQNFVGIAPRDITKVQIKLPVATNAQVGTTVQKTVLLNVLNVKVDFTTKALFQQ